MKILAVYPGRFQPFHKGHAQVYKWLKLKFGDVVIATSDKVEAPKSPFNFKEKKRMMMLAGVPSKDIKQVTNPYIAREILKNYDPKETVLVFAVSQKDMEEDPRFSFAKKKDGKPGYLQPYAGNEKKLKPFGDAQSPKGYVIVTPTFTFDVLGKPATSASELRKQFVTLDNKKQKEFIKDLFGKYDEAVHKLMKEKIGAMQPKQKSIKQLREEVTRKELAPMLDSFVSFASNKLGLKSMPNVRYKTDDDQYNSFAAYNPTSNELSICTANRHPMDIFRSVAHELVHHKQNEDGRLGKNISKEGSTGSNIENEANAEAGKIMRWFAKANPDMFGKSYVVETNMSSLVINLDIGIKDIPKYVISNLNHVHSDVHSLIDAHHHNHDKNIQNKYKASKSFSQIRKSNRIITEGINDPGKLKAIFLAGGPGSGKDFVMNSSLAGEGLREVNSDTAFEFLMKKHGLDMEMPEEEKIERDIVRGRAKNITKEKERNSLSGRLGLIINGTADDLEKIKLIKKNLEADGYETMMVFVNTSNDVSKQRNVERGKGGGRKVPDGTDKQGIPNGTEDIRTEKWEIAQKNIGELQKIFGNENFAVIDNTVDIRKATPEIKEKVLADFSRLRRMAQQFVRAENQNPAAKSWIEGEAKKRGITDYREPKRYKTLTQVRQAVPQVVHKPDNELMAQARRLGLSYYGFGRFGRKVGNENKVLYHSKGGKLVKVQTMNEEKKMSNPCWKGYKALGMKKKNGKEVPNCIPVDEAFEKFMQSMGNKSLEEKKKIKLKKKKLNQEALTAPEPWGYNFGGDGIGPTASTPRTGTPYGFGYSGAYSSSLSESIQKWMNLERTQQKYMDKYGNIWEQKLVESAINLENSGCGCENIKIKKSVKKIREGNEGGVNMMGTVPTQRKIDDIDETISKEGENYVVRSEKGKNLGLSSTREGAVKRLRQVEYFKHMKESETWQTKEGQNRNGGLNAKGRAQYNRDHGSHLKRPQPEGGKRRDSYCARSAGQLKMWPKAAKDPNSRLRKARRKWKCEE